MYFYAHNKPLWYGLHAVLISDCMELLLLLKPPCKCSPVKDCMCNGENDRNRKLSQD